MATATFDFTGANGAAWPSGWTTAIAGTGAAAVINTNRGALTTKNTAWSIGNKAYLSSVYATELDLVLDVTFPAIVEQYFNIELRASDSASADSLPPNSYYLQIFPHAGAASVGLSKRVGGTETSISGNLTTGAAWVANVARRIRFQVTGSTLRLKVWDPAGVEPATWLGSYTDTSLTAPGSLFLAEISGPAASNHTVYVDNVSLTYPDPVVVPTVPNQTSGTLLRTTSGGTKIYRYRVVTDAATAGLTAAQKDAYLYVPETKSAATAAKFVIASHGLGDVAGAFMEQIGGTLDLLDRLADAGYVVIVPEYEATLGNPDGQARLVRAYNYLLTKWTPAGTVLFGFSAGGNMSAIAVHKQLIPNIKAAQLVSPVVDWLPFNDPATYPTESAAWYAAWNTDQAGFAAATADTEPYRQPASKFTGANIRANSAGNDGYVSIRPSTVAWLDKIRPVAKQAIDIEVFGNHGNVTQFAYPDAMMAFFEAATALTVPLSGSGTLTATAVPSVARTVALSGSGTLTRSVVPAIARTVGLSGSGTLTRSVVPATSRTIGLSGSGTLAASAAPATTRSVGLSGSGTLAGSVASATTRTVALSGSGTLTGAATRQVSTTANLSGGGTLSGGITGMSLSASAALSGSGTLVAGGVNNAAVPGNLSGSGALSPSLTSVSFTVTKGLSGSGQGSLSASAVAARTVQVQLSGVGTLVGVGAPVGVPDPMYNYDVFAYLAEKRWSGSLGLQRKGSR